jgi:hypothetical protein
MAATAFGYRTVCSCARSRVEQKSRPGVFEYHPFSDILGELGSTLSAEDRVGVETKSMIYKVALQRANCELETLYWEGSLEETIGLARSVAFEGGFKEFRIIESGGRGAEVFSEQLPSSKHG